MRGLVKGRRTFVRRRGVAAVVAGACVMAFGAAACGDDEPKSTSSAPTSSKSDAAGGDYVAKAKQITDEAKSGLIYAPRNEFTPADELKAMKEWLGPTESPQVPQGKSIAFVSCGAVVCNEAVQAGAKIARGVGFKTHLVNINGKADIPNLNDAMSSAIALKPSAIVGMCITATQVADKLEQARKAGIVTVSICDPTPTGGNGQFDTAADYANGLSTELLGWGIVADSEGKANVVAVKDEGYPAVIRKIGNLARVVEECSGCKMKTATWQITDAVDSAKAANIITGLINGNPKMDTLVMPYSVGMPSVLQAVANSGRKIKVYADDLDAVNLQALKAGSLAMVSSVDPELAMYQAVDQVIRGINKEPYVEPAKLPYLAHLFTQSDAPKTGVGAFQKLFDYASVYRELWGKQ